ncbi:P-loop containing nucleoside triphosphate hydrolase protein [Naematelia encephala]|uniref:p-loop containing nucleoside triphosphate hydrolase protein n=1 Tax=Naematelia encephala TaxID=71784 RepID=A0A1Y2BDA1_9TREE|nr:P-loop containing nucleoside triphosphate hydrolase protein [Naematelia encephala]
MSSMPGRPLSSLQLVHSIKSSLNEAGYKSTDDLAGISAQDLAGELNISLIQAENILQQAISGPSKKHPVNMGVGDFSLMLIGSTPGPSHNGISESQQPTRTPRIHSSTAAELLETASKTCFSTFSSSLDSLISHFAPDADYVNDGRLDREPKGKQKVWQGGHILPGMTIEVSGPPGGGKTSLALGIAINARMKSLHGVKGGPPDDQQEVLIVDTEGSISAERILLAADSVTRNTSFSPSAIIRGIRLMRIATQVQMVAFLLWIEEWLEEHPKVNLLIIDSLSFHFRNPHLDNKLKSRYLDLAKQAFARATAGRQCALIVTNQLATKLLTANNEPANFDTGDRAVLMPQLGEAWTTAQTIRIILFRGGSGDELRYAHASTSGEAMNIPWAPFDINVDGLPCDIPTLPENDPS